MRAYHCTKCNKMVYVAQMDMIPFFCWKCKEFKGHTEVEVREAD